MAKTSSKNVRGPVKCKTCGADKPASSSISPRCRTCAPCDTCKFHEKGVIHGYPWETCEKGWREEPKDPKAPVVGVFGHHCNLHAPKT